MIFACARTINPKPFNHANIDLSRARGKEKEYFHPDWFSIPEDVLKGIRALDLKLGSVDLYCKKGTWGIFEYSNEFGISSVRQGFITELLTNF